MERREVSKRLLAGSLWSWGALGSTGVVAQTTFPTRPIRMLVGFAAGGPTDNAARMIAEAMGRHLGQPVTVENRPGANALLAVAELLRSKPDGHSILLASNGSLTVAPARFAKLPYDVKRDLTLIGPVVAYPHVLVVPANHRIEDFASFMRAAKNRSPGLNGATVGHVNDLSIEWLNKLLSAHITRIPYKGDSAVVSDLISNRLDFALLAPNIAMPLIASKKLKAIALTSSGSTPVLNKFKTVRESGLQDFDVEIWNALVAPAGTPPDVIAKLAASLRKAQDTPEIQSNLALSGQHVQLGNTEGLSQRIEREISQWQAIARDAGMPLLEL